MGLHTCYQHHFFLIPSKALAPTWKADSGPLEPTKTRCKLQQHHWRVSRSWRAFLGTCRRTCILEELSDQEESCRVRWREVGRGKLGLLLGTSRLSNLFLLVSLSCVWQRGEFPLTFEHGSELKVQEISGGNSIMYPFRGSSPNRMVVLEKIWGAYHHSETPLLSSYPRRKSAQLRSLGIDDRCTQLYPV